MGRLSAVWRFLFGHSARAAVTLAVVAIAIALIPLLSSGSADTAWTRPPAPAEIQTENDLEQYVLSRTLWKAKPTVYPSSLRIAFHQQSIAHGRDHAAHISEGEPYAFSAGELTAEGSQYPGQVLYLVGRLKYRTRSPTPSGALSSKPMTDIELASPFSDRRVYGLAPQPVGVHTGEVAFVRVVIAAVGTGPSDHTVTYVIALEGLNKANDMAGSHTLRHYLDARRKSARRGEPDARSHSDVGHTGARM
jgi:hypothetical protein